jgi:DNA-binding MarR family transcriptional regulator
MTKSSSRPQAAARTLYLIKQLETEVRLCLEEALRGFGLTPSLYLVLEVVARRPDLSAADLARRLSMTPQSMNELIAVLERGSLVHREADPANRRVLRIRATGAGTALVAHCDRAVDAIEAEAFAGLEGEALQTFRRALSTSIDRMRAQRLDGQAALAAAKAALGARMGDRGAPAPAREAPGAQTDALRSRAMRS